MKTLKEVQRAYYEADDTIPKNPDLFDCFLRHGLIEDPAERVRKELGSNEVERLNGIAETFGKMIEKRPITDRLIARLHGEFWKTENAISIHGWGVWTSTMSNFCTLCYYLTEGMKPTSERLDRKTLIAYFGKTAKSTQIAKEVSNVRIDANGGKDIKFLTYLRELTKEIKEELAEGENCKAKNQRVGEIIKELTDMGYCVSVWPVFAK